MYSVLLLVLQNAHFLSLLHDAFSPIHSQAVQIRGALTQPEMNLVVCHLKFAWSGSQLIQLLTSHAWYINYLADRQPDKAHLFPTSCNEITSQRKMLVISVGNRSLEKPYALIQNAPLAGNMLIRLWNICMLKAQSGPQSDADIVET